ncbi:Carboxylic ester hydrolase [Penicillium ucsense]|uniref:Carboxylic ester hydrolase n=1 Tax=Penicillium ucsense TaxID=2839758 RepID=A0A8J8WEX0_9EURO|nr:Carboxylic ester hydrolase [Penicillium ucsense]KAF7729182.1 Carboxylic ester hydrolase [Penicillium ucsense]
MAKFSLLFLASLAAAKAPVVDLGYTKYEGRSLANGVSQWLGIRYAAPPLNELRFAAPQDPLAQEGVQQATQHGALCVPVASSLNQSVPEGTSEDCLFLDVYAPTEALANGKKLPVYFFIQGGGFASLSNNNYNGSGLIKASDSNIVVVNFNYRVGPFGFLASEEVAKGGSLNNGLKDQIKALQWVKKHIDKFGGNPDHVVIGGDSAGGGSVTLLLSAYGGRDDKLFVGAAAESQSFANMLDVKGSQFVFDRLASRTGCEKSADPFACLRKLDIGTLQAQNIVSPYPGAPGNPLYLYGPTVDGDLVPDYTLKLFNQGKFIKVPVIFGDATNEGTVFVPKSTNNVSAADDFLKSQFNTITDCQLAKINSLYLTENQTRQFPDAGIYWRPASNAYGDLRYTCPGVDLSSVYEKAGIPSWNYHYDVKDPKSEASGEGVTHTVEINAIWGPENVHGGAPASYSTGNANIVPVMQGYWTSFVRALNPNTHRYHGTPEWKTWGKGEEAYRRIYIRTNQTHMETVPQVERERCAYLLSLGEHLRQ